jgi:hypothetical protein
VRGSVPVRLSHEFGSPSAGSRREPNYVDAEQARCANTSIGVAGAGSCAITCKSGIGGIYESSWSYSSSGMQSAGSCL